MRPRKWVAVGIRVRGSVMPTAYLITTLAHSEIYTKRVALIRPAKICVRATRVPARGKSTIRMTVAPCLTHMAHWGRLIAKCSRHLFICAPPCTCVRVLNGRRGSKSRGGGNRVPWGPSTSACRSSNSTSVRRLGGKRVRDRGSQVPWGPDTNVSRSRTSPCPRQRGSDWTFDGGSRVPWGPNTSVGDPLAPTSRWRPFRNRWHPPRTTARPTLASVPLPWKPCHVRVSRQGRGRRLRRLTLGFRLRRKVPSHELRRGFLVRNLRPC